MQQPSHRDYLQSQTYSTHGSIKESSWGHFHFFFNIFFLAFSGFIDRIKMIHSFEQCGNRLGSSLSYIMPPFTVRFVYVYWALVKLRRLSCTPWNMSLFCGGGALAVAHRENLYLSSRELFLIWITRLGNKWLHLFTLCFKDYVLRFCIQKAAESPTQTADLRHNTVYRDMNIVCLRECSSSGKFCLYILSVPSFRWLRYVFLLVPEVSGGQHILIYLA